MTRFRVTSGSRGLRGAAPCAHFPLAVLEEYLTSQEATHKILHATSRLVDAEPGKQDGRYLVSCTSDRSVQLISASISQSYGKERHLAKAALRRDSDGTVTGIVCVQCDAACAARELGSCTHVVSLLVRLVFFRRAESCKTSLPASFYPPMRQAAREAASHLDSGAEEDAIDKPLPAPARVADCRPIGLHFRVPSPPQAPAIAPTPELSAPLDVALQHAEKRLNRP